jgi:hypothetical protein
MVVVISFFAGGIFGVVTAICIGLYLSKQDEQYTKAINEKLKMEKIKTSVRARFDQIQKIIDRQISLQQSTSAPSKSASHSRWKNDLNRQILEMEKEKIEICRSILADGVDPLITIMGNNNEIVKIRMSEAITRFEAGIAEQSTHYEKLKKVPTKPKLRVITTEE